MLESYLVILKQTETNDTDTMAVFVYVFNFSKKMLLLTRLGLYY